MARLINRRSPSLVSVFFNVLMTTKNSLFGLERLLNQRRVDGAVVGCRRDVKDGAEEVVDLDVGEG